MTCPPRGARHLVCALPVNGAPGHHRTFRDDKHYDFRWKQYLVRTGAMYRDYLACEEPVVGNAMPGYAKYYAHRKAMWTEAIEY